jgi:hypothetical protein
MAAYAPVTPSLAGDVARPNQAGEAPMTSTENAECRQTAFGMILWLAFFPQLVF